MLRKTEKERRPEIGKEYRVNKGSLADNTTFNESRLSSNNKEYEGVVSLLGNYLAYEKSIREGRKYVDNGLRANVRYTTGVGSSKLKGLWLENSLGQVLESMNLTYSLQVPFEDHWVTDAVVILRNNTFLRIEAKYVNERYADSNWKYKNFLDWSTKYYDKPKFFYPYTILYINYEFYRILSKEDFKICYRNGLLIANFRTLTKTMRERIWEI
jgi:hypothetical protein